MATRHDNKIINKGAGKFNMFLIVPQIAFFPGKTGMFRIK